MSEIDDLENLLNEAQKEYDKIKYNQYNNIENGVFDSKLLKADKSASFYDFITMIDKIVTKTLSEYNVEFIPDEGKIVYLSNDEKLDHPIITYKLKERKPKGELKPRIREHFMEDKGDSNSRIGEIYGQRFKCHLQFNIFASEYKTCNEIMDKFEDLMIIYAGYFKKNGVGEIIFDKQYTDEDFKHLRQTLSIRNLCYYVEIEKLTVIMRESIKTIDIY